jgi:DNA-binding protein YbaB
VTEQELAGQVEAALAQAHRAAARARRASAEIEDLRGTGRSAGGVTAEVDHRGLVQDVRIPPSAMDLGKDGLRDAILGAVADAQSDLRAQAREIVPDTAPPRPPAESTEVLDLADRLVRGRP